MSCFDSSTPILSLFPGTCLVIKYVNLRRSILRGMQFHKTTKSITDTMKNYLRLLWDNHHGCQVPQLLLRSPVPLQQKLCWILYRHHFNEHLLFSGCNVLFLRQLIVHLKTQFLFPGNVAVESGIVDDTMYFVHKGEIDIYERDDIDSHSKWRFVSKMATGGCFGIEQGLGRGLAHSHRIVAHTCVTLLKLEFQSWSYLLYYYPVIRKKLIKYLANKGIS
ncbi:potassium channel KOR1 [Nilaparvata lugens]|uniref:potassium channel KOR1 n=1 Tax=Nilaparvata lugens TaxID=108931 RepID=UPI00193CD93F|nr:potassium channel KOR1 [Nilaparvata lugens]